MNLVRSSTLDFAGTVVRLADLDRPTKANALDARTVEELHLVVEQASRDAADIVVFGSTGPVFCGGLDLSDLRLETDATLLYRLCRIELLFEKIRTAPFLTVANVAGPAVGAGADLVIACAHRVASMQASLRFPGNGFGAVLGVERLVHATNPGLAGHLVLTGESLGATDAAAAGVWTLVSDWDRELNRLVGVIQARPIGAVPAVVDALGPARTEDPLGRLVRSLAGTPGLRERVHDYARRSTPVRT